MTPTTIHLPPTEFAAALGRQIARLRNAASAFVETADAEGLGRAMPALLRDLVAISTHSDLERLSPVDGQRLAELCELHRAGLHREFGASIPAGRIEAGLTAAVAMAGMVGRPWVELEAIPDALLRGRTASVTVLANSIESAALADIAAQIEPNGAPAGRRLH